MAYLATRGPTTTSSSSGGSWPASWPTWSSTRTWRRPAKGSTCPRRSRPPSTESPNRSDGRVLSDGNLWPPILHPIRTPHPRDPTSPDHDVRFPRRHRQDILRFDRSRPDPLHLGRQEPRRTAPTRRQDEEADLLLPGLRLPRARVRGGRVRCCPPGLAEIPRSLHRRPKLQRHPVHRDRHWLLPLGSPPGLRVRKARTGPTDALHEGQLRLHQADSRSQSQEQACDLVPSPPRGVGHEE